MTGFLSGKGLALGAGLVVLATVAASLLAIESPWTARAKRIDALRTYQLAAIAGAVDCHWTLVREAGLPASLDELRARLEDEAARWALPGRCMPGAWSDPETGIAYGFTPVGGGDYELCATFARASAQGGSPGAPRYGNDDGWIHRKGRHCFRLSARAVDLPGMPAAR